MSEVTSGQIKQALADRHCQDFFMAEVKNGPTQTGMLQVDAVAINKSWAHQTMTGYEIKISRGDFLRDPKMHLYLQYFHEFYIVCPAKMIDKREIPDSMGLIWYNPETKQLQTKKKAAYRKIEPDADILWYILMYRMQPDRYPFHDCKKDWITDYLQNKSENHRLGYQFSTKMAREHDKLLEKNERLSRNGDYQQIIKDITAIAQKHNIRVWHPEELAAALDKGLERKCPAEVETALLQIDAARRTLDQIMKPPVDPEEEKQLGEAI